MLFAQILLTATRLHGVMKQVPNFLVNGVSTRRSVANDKFCIYTARDVLLGEQNDDATERYKQNSNNSKRGSSVSTVNGLWATQEKHPVWVPGITKGFSYSQNFIDPLWGPSGLLSDWHRSKHSPGVKWPQGEADNTPHLVSSLKMTEVNIRIHITPSRLTHNFYINHIWKL